MKHLDLFSGIGGFALATEMVWGKEVEHTFCDNEPFAKAILKKHWPNSKIYGDIRTLTADADSADGQTRAYEKERKQGQQSPQSLSVGRNKYDLLTGGFPCQPFFQAGRRLGTEDSRHLWPEMLRVIREFKPRWVIGENVGGLVTWSGGLVLEQIHLDLEAAGYEVQAFIIPAVSVNAPHRRDRVWIVAHNDTVASIERRDNGSHNRQERYIPTDEGSSAKSEPERQGRERGSWSFGADAPDTRRERRSARPSESMESASKEPEWENNRNSSWNANWLEVATRLCTLDDGLPRGLARPKGWRNAALKGAGNAIVPQVAAEIMQAIKLCDTSLT